MGTYIRTRVQQSQRETSSNKGQVLQITQKDEWVNSYHYAYFDLQSYSFFGWLANVRNYSGVKPIMEPQGFPEGFDDYFYKKEKEDAHSMGWITSQTLAEIDYDQIVEDRRVTKEIGPNYSYEVCTCDPGRGVRKSLREFLGPDVMAEIELFIRLENGRRLVFWFVG